MKQLLLRNFGKTMPKWISSLMVMLVFSLSFSLNAEAQYCEPSYTNGPSNGDYIASVQFLSIFNAPPQTVGYNNFSGISTDIQEGTSAYVKIGVGQNPDNHYGVWVDWDQNLSFEAGEFIGEFTGFTPYNIDSLNILVPGGVMLGQTRMRIKCKTTTISPTGACTGGINGEVEDYSINVVAATSGYCSPLCTSGVNGYYIESVMLGSINNVSGQGIGYDDFTLYSTDVDMGASYILEINSGMVSPTQYVAWIDWDQDKIFQAGEQIGNYSNASPYEMIIMNFVVPTGIPSGMTRMRIVATDVNADACLSPFSGEYEDYSINVMAGVTCMSDFNFYADTSLFVSFSDMSSNATSWAWDFDGDMITDAFTQFPGGWNYASPGTYQVSLAISDGVGCFDTVWKSVTVPFSQPGYCSATAIDTVYEYINYVSFGAISNSSGNMVYSNFTTMVTDLTIGTAQNISVSIGNSYASDIVYVWIDWDKNGDFYGVNELAWMSPQGVGPHSGSITAPGAAIVGTTRMRVMLVDNNSNPNPMPCDTVQYGEVEDYSVNILAGPDCLADYYYSANNLDVSFVDMSMNATSWQWDFDGNWSWDSFSPNSAWTYASPGTYLATLVIFDGMGCSDTVQNVIEVVAGPACLADYSYSASNLNVSFGDMSINATSWQWDFDGDMVIDAGTQNAAFSYPVAGIYYATLIINDGIGCIDTVTYMIEVVAGPACYAGWWENPDTMNVKAVTFQDSSTPAAMISSWSWDFGDGFTSGLSNPYHVYPDTGKYYVCLIIVTDDSCTTQTCRWVDVGTIGPACVADFSFIINNYEVTFMDQSLNAMNWAWDFDGDYNIDDSVMANPYYIYSSSGTYNATLTITDGVSCSSSISYPITVPGTSASCEANWYYTTDGATTMANFQDMSFGMAPNSWSWDFDNDGTMDSFSPNPSWNFPSAGTYWVCMNLVDGNGCTSSNCDWVTVGSGASNCYASWSYYNDGTSLVASFNDYSSGASPMTWSWDFDGDSIADANNAYPSYSFPVAGEYNVCLTISDINGCSSSYCQIVSIGLGNQNCNADYFYSTNAATNVAYFENISYGGGGLTYSWDFNNDGTQDANIPHPVWDFGTPGTFWVCLTISDSLGCSSTRCDNVVVNDTASGTTCNANWGYSNDGVSTWAYFSDYSYGGPGMIWSWDFNGDGFEDSNIPNPGYNFGAPGSYWVCLTISSGNCSNVWCNSVIVGSGSGTCNAIWSYTAGAIAGRAYFSDMSSGGANMTYSWDFTGDGIGDKFTANPMWDFGADGSYWVCLTISDGNGCTDTYCSSVVLGSGTSSCNANWSYTSDGTSNWAYFDNYSTGGTGMTYSWDFNGDNIPDNTNAYPAYDFGAPGSYWVCLTINDQNGCSSTWCNSVSVGSAGSTCNANFSFTTVTGTNNAYFSNMSTGGAGLMYNWDFDSDGITDATYANPTWTFTSAGSYWVCLTVYDSLGCSNVLCKDVTVGDTVATSTCNADWTYSNGGATNVVYFTNYSTGEAGLTYAWDFNSDGITDKTTASPMWDFGVAGTYWVCLNIYNPNTGCSDSWCSTVTVGNATATCNADWAYSSDATSNWAYFTNYSTGQAGLTYSWDFNGDGMTDNTNSNPAYDFGAPGTYWVCLNIYNPNTGCSDYWCNSVTVGSGATACNADWTYTTGTNTNIAYFSNLSSGAYGLMYSWDFTGDGTTDKTNANPMWDFGAPGTYWVCLMVYDSLGCYDEYCREVMVGDTVGTVVCNADWSYTNNGVTNVAYFSNYSSGASGLVYAWDFNSDGITDKTTASPTWDFGAPGTFWVCLNITGSTGCYDTWCNSVTVGNATATCNADWAYSSSATSNWAYFTNYSTGQAGLTYAWDFNGDGITDNTTSNPAYDFSAPGTYWVCLNIYNPNTGCSDYWCNSVAVGAATNVCNADWSYTNNGVTNIAYFSNYSTGNAGMTYSWDFNEDGITDKTTMNPSNDFGSAGTYWVCLTITDANGTCVDTWCNSVTVGTVTSTCDADWYYTTQTGSNSAYFVNLSSGTNIMYSWDFNSDGIEDSNIPNPTYTYGSAGNFWVCLTVYDTAGCSDSWCNSVLVGDTTTTATCVSQFNFFVDTMDVYFNNMSSINASTYYWDFDDGTTSTAKHPVHTYSTPGDYWVCLTITTTSGCIRTSCQAVSVGSASQCIASFNPWTNATNTAYFTNMSSGGVVNYYWDFGDASTSASENPSHTYATAGSYWVCLTADNGAGCSDSYCTLIEVGTVSTSCNLVIVASATNASCYSKSDGTATVTVTSGSSPYSYHWSNGAFSATATGLSSGTYSVTVYDDNFCEAISTITVGSPTLLVASASAVNATCGQSDGQVIASATGGTSPYTYVWANNSTSSTLTGLAAGSYSVTVTDSNVCTKSKTVAVSDDGGISVTVNSSSNVTGCAGNSNGAINIDVAGGTSPYTYSWSSGETDQNISGISTGSYTVLVTSSSGCVGSLMVEIDEPEGMTLSTSSTNANCGTPNGTASVSVSGGTGSYSYLWSNDSISASISQLSAGSYSVVVTDDNACSNSASVSISEIGAATVTVDSSLDVSCNGDTDGAIYLSVTGGMAPFTYMWTSGGNTQDVTGLAPAAYFVFITGSNGCQAVRYIVIGEPDELSVSASNEFAHCGYDDGQSYTTVQGGTAPYTYSWSNNGTDATGTGLVVGSNSVTVVDDNGCTVSTSTTITTGVDQPSICVVTVDTSETLMKNLIVWEKVPGLGISSYVVYKESVVAGLYSVLGSVPYGDASLFTDIGSDPLAQSDRYKIQAVDSCGNYSAMSTWHNTMRLMVSMAGPGAGYNLVWNDYDEEDGTVAMNSGTYHIYRGTSVNNLSLFTSISTNQANYTDLDTSTQYFYMIAFDLPVVCDPAGGAKLMTGPFSQSMSNLDDNGIIEGIVVPQEVFNSLDVYPNPFANMTNISYSLIDAANVELSIFNTLGQKIAELVNDKQVAGDYTVEFSASDYGKSAGVYFMKLKVNDEVTTVKLVETR